MIAYVVLVELLTGGQSDGLKFFKYIFFAFPAASGLCRLSRGKVDFFRFLPQSTIYTAIVSLTAASLMVLAYWVTLPMGSINMATIPAAQASAALATTSITPLPESFMLFLEVFAMSMIIGFALLTYGTDFKAVNVIEGQ